METVQDLKNDINKTKTVLKKEQEIFKQEIDNGLFDDADEILSNPETNNYYEKTLDLLNKEQLKTSEKRENKKNLWKKFKENLKKIMLQ